MTASTTMSQEVGFSQANTIKYAVNQILLGVNTCLPCEIKEITGSTYTIQPLNNTIGADGTPYDPPLIYNVPYALESGGNAGFIIEPAIGDKVLVVFSQRDISIIKKEWAKNNPESYRKFSLADAIIVKRLSNDLPNIFIKVTSAGIELTAPILPINVNCDTANVNADTVNLGNGTKQPVLVGKVAMTATIGGVQAGSGVTDVPITITDGFSSKVNGAV